MTYTERYVRADAAGGGDGTTDTNSGGTGAFTLTEAITNAASNNGIRFNIKSGTYTLAANLDFPAAVGESPNIWQGFNSTPGDLFSAGRSATTGELVTTNFPLIDGGASYSVASIGTSNGLINLNITQSGNRATVTSSGSSTSVFILRCKISNTASTGTSARVFTFGASSTIGIVDNDLVCSTNSAAFVAAINNGIVAYNRVWNTTGSPNATFYGIGLSGTSTTAIGNVVYNCGRGVVCSSQSNVINNSISSVTDGLLLTSVPVLVLGNVFNAVSGYLFTGTNAGNPILFKNASTTPTSGRLDTANIGSVIEEIEGIALTGNPFVDSANGDFRLNDTSGAGRACKKLLPFWGSLADLGAVQSLNGGIGFLKSMAGGFPE